VKPIIRILSISTPPVSSSHSPAIPLSQKNVFYIWPYRWVHHCIFFDEMKFYFISVRLFIQLLLVFV